MTTDWQNIMALTAVALAAVALAIRWGIFRRGRKDTGKIGCRACSGCRQRDYDK